MNFNEIYNKTLDYYKVKTDTDLSKIIKTERTTLSGWKSRQAIGQLLDCLNKMNDKQLMGYIYDNEQHIGLNINNAILEKITDIAQEYNMTKESFVESILLNEIRKG